MQINKRLSFWGICDYHTLSPQEEQLDQAYKLLYPVVTDQMLKEDERKFRYRQYYRYKENKEKMTGKRNVLKDQYRDCKLKDNGYK
jgi:hypothetical protein